MLRVYQSVVANTEVVPVVVGKGTCVGIFDPREPRGGPGKLVCGLPRTYLPRHQTGPRPPVTRGASRAALAGPQTPAPPLQLPPDTGARLLHLPPQRAAHAVAASFHSVFTCKLPLAGGSRVTCLLPSYKGGW